MVKNNRLTLQNIIYLIDQMSEVIIENEVPFCELDAHAGDGDFGMSVAKGFKRLKAEWDDILTHHLRDIGDFLDACSMIIMEHCGGLPDRSGDPHSGRRVNLPVRSRNCPFKRLPI